MDSKNVIVVDEQLYKELEKEFIERALRKKAEEDRKRMHRTFKDSIEYNNRSYDIFLQQSI
jgi:hypothetical protein